MASVFEEVTDDLAEEHRALERVLDRLAPSVFEKATHAIGWAVRDQVAHLAHFDEAAALAITDAEALREHFRRPENGEPAYLERARTLAHGDLLEWWRTASSNLRAALESLDPAARIRSYEILAEVMAGSLASAAPVRAIRHAKYISERL